MSRNKKPRKAYRPRPVTAHTMTLATHYAAKPSASDRKEVLDMLSSAIQALREGVATEHQWSIAAGSVAVALAIERQGIVRGLLGHQDRRAGAAGHLRPRPAHRWRPLGCAYALYYQELDALQTFLDLHAFQVRQLGRAEFLAAIDIAHKDTIAQGHTRHSGARSGKDGRMSTVKIHVKVVERTDLALLVSDGREEAWVPLSQIDEVIEEPGLFGMEVTAIVVPEWLASDKGLQQVNQDEAHAGFIRRGQRTPAFLLMAQYNAEPSSLWQWWSRTTLPDLTTDNFLRKVAVGDIKIPLVRIEPGSEKGARGVHLTDLAQYLDDRRAAAVKEEARAACRRSFVSLTHLPLNHLPTQRRALCPQKNQPLPAPRIGQPWPGSRRYLCRHHGRARRPA